VNDNYLEVAKAVGLTAHDLVTLARNSFEASFLPDALRREFVDEVGQVARKFGVTMPGGKAQP
jgi:adenosine deaminase